MERLSQSIGGSFGRLLGRETQAPQGQIAAYEGEEPSRIGVGELSVPQPSERLLSMTGSPVYEGVPVAKRPRHQQISCMTCSQSLEPQQRQLRCHVCSAWIHDYCVETLHIGSKWNADMCLTCQQGMTKQLRVISAQELRKGHHWDQDKWIRVLRDCVAAETGYGITRNKDLNELEIRLARAIQSGINLYKDANLGSSPTEAEASGGLTPVAEVTAPVPEEPPEELPKGETSKGGTEGAHDQPFADRTGVRAERDARRQEDTTGRLSEAHQGSFHSPRSELREEREYEV